MRATVAIAVLTTFLALALAGCGDAGAVWSGYDSTYAETPNVVQMGSLGGSTLLTSYSGHESQKGVEDLPAEPREDREDSHHSYGSLLLAIALALLFVYL